MESLQTSIDEIKLETLKEKEIAKCSERHAIEIETGLSSIADGVIVYDKSGNIIYLNEAAKKISGLTKSDYIRPFAERITSVVSSNGKPFRFEDFPFNRAIKGE